MNKSRKQEKLNARHVICLLMLIVAFIVAVVSAAIMFCSTDFKPATTADWDYLYEQLDKFESQGLSSAYDLDDVKITVSEKTVVIESEQCSLSFLVDNNGNLSESTRDDKAALGVLSITSLTIIIVSLSISFAIITLFVEVLLCVLCDFCFHKIKSLYDLCYLLYQKLKSLKPWRES